MGDEEQQPPLPVEKLVAVKNEMLLQLIIPKCS
jgi:hypothetical protein